MAAFPISISAFTFSNNVSRHNFSQTSAPLVRSKITTSPKASRSSETHSQSSDIVIVGAGIIGLSIARQFLLKSNLSVAIVDAAVPCFGATGAGQGYIWRVHKDPQSVNWELGMRSHQLWEKLADDLTKQGVDPLNTLGWMKTGSLLVGRSAEESNMLSNKVDNLKDAGIQASFLSNKELKYEEPTLKLGVEGSAAFLPNDYQIDARSTVAFIEKGNRQFATEGRYAEFYHEPVTGLLRSGNSGEVEGVETSKNFIHSKKAVILATGCWSGSLIHDLLKDSDIVLNLPFKPRKGHLLVLENFRPFKLNHGLMEFAYVNRQFSASDKENLSVSMTATMDKSGSLVLGSSRQFVGFDTQINESIINSIWDRAREFFPLLQEHSLDELRKHSEVRVGLRPYVSGGKPKIGNVQGLSNLFLAAGHEGEGLSLALGTAELVTDIVLGNTLKADPSPYRP